MSLLVTLNHLVINLLINKNWKHETIEFFIYGCSLCCILFVREDEDKQVHSITAFAGYGGAIATADKEIAVAEKL